MKEENTALTDEKIQAWKSEFGHVYQTVIGGETFIWRKLKRKEYVKCMTMNMDGKEHMEKVYARQDYVAKSALLFPDKTTAGKMLENNGALATALSDEILMRSGFDVKETEEL